MIKVKVLCLWISFCFKFAAKMFTTNIQEPRPTNMVSFIQVKCHFSLLLINGAILTVDKRLHQLMIFFMHGLCICHRMEIMTLRRSGH